MRAQCSVGCECGSERLQSDLTEGPSLFWNIPWYSLQPVPLPTLGGDLGADLSSTDQTSKLLARRYLCCLFLEIQAEVVPWPKAHFRVCPGMEQQAV